MDGDCSFLKATPIIKIVDLLFTIQEPILITVYLKLFVLPLLPQNVLRPQIGKYTQTSRYPYRNDKVATMLDYNLVTTLYFETVTRLQ